VVYVEGLAHRDGLTGVFNKGAYDERSEALEAKIKAGEEPPFTIIMLDVNDLKGVNDNCGHMAGDDYLKAAAKCIGECFRDGTIYRIGGDEFVLMYEREAADEVREGIEKLWQAIQKTADMEEPWKRIWMAYGVATYDKDTDSSVMDVFERADAAMYERKRQMKEGRPVEE
jgi:diguanylate cyclase (GGDEF)-like protein